MTNSLAVIEKKLIDLNKNSKKKNYAIPGVWRSFANMGQELKVEPTGFFLSKLNEIKMLASTNSKSKQNGNKLNKNRVYNLFIRYNLAYDHNSDNDIKFTKNSKDFRETGTFLKAISLLPYLYTLGINTIYLLPITSIGKIGKKGNLGSPYSIKNPYQLDESLNESKLQMSVEEQFRAFVEAAHLLGMKIVLEFIFRTASIDSDLALQHPEWFYWVYSEYLSSKETFSKHNSTNRYKQPEFTKFELKQINEAVENGNFDNLIPPKAEYKQMFAQTPKKVIRKDGHIIGIIDDGKQVEIPSAFADWPPNDTQPLWSDVTYLKLFEHPDFNYIAYNTVRMYDNKLNKPENINKTLWDSITGIIPYYIKEFDIDGVMIDMGHSLPKELLSSIITNARELKQDFIFWEENFNLSEDSINKGFDASLGYMPFVQDEPAKLKEILKMFEDGKCPIPFFATAETHNTPRAVTNIEKQQFSKFAYAFNSLLPTINFIHSGFEICEAHPVNTGLMFSEKDYIKYPSENLPLFSIMSMNWNNVEQIINFIIKVNSISAKYSIDIYSSQQNSIKLIETINPELIAFTRKSLTHNKELLFICNMSTRMLAEKIHLPKTCEKFYNELDNTEFQIYGNILTISLKPYEVYMGIIE